MKRKKDKENKKTEKIAICRLTFVGNSAIDLGR